MQLTCMNCQTVNSDDARYCEECGTIVKQSFAPQSENKLDIENSTNTEYIQAQKPNLNQNSNNKNQVKDPNLAFLLSLIIPGFAFFMVSEILIGALIFLFTIFLLNSDTLFLLGLLIYIVQLKLGMDRIKQYNLT